MAEEAVQALRARSLRSIRTELEFLADTSAISQQQLNNILSNLPDIPEYSRPNSSSNGTTTVARPSQQLISPVASPPPERAPERETVQRSQTEPQPPTQQLNDMHIFNRRQQSQPQQQQQHYAAPPSAPPAYSSVPPVLSIASAVYAYHPTDAGDLELHPNDRVQVIEHMNNDWWRGRNERTGAEGIFPRTYVNVIEDKSTMAMSTPPPPTAPPQSNSGPMSYGNMPMAVAQGSSAPTPAPAPVAATPEEQQQQQGQEHPHLSKVEEGGKKFGKKLGNAAIFGAGATIGSNIVNSIF
ncbi:SH3 domain protein [Ascosphaera apis ARSEF 7405]|uniref:SH3 domain protein n=1 Tax=Ascosphaera apis ARSEF 7405 TaxID=392613 RepID=A0A167YXF0_9EURO|nr:SH3 domain protein [Ascosphaera apis ARSEF 7405]